MSAPLRIGFFLPHFRPGGAERVVLNWIGALDRVRFHPFLFLMKPEGAFLDLLPPGIRPIALGGRRALHLPRRIAAALEAHEIDIAYAATNAMNLALLAARGVTSARIVSEHTSPAQYLAEAKQPWLRRRLMRHFYPRADAVAVPTDRIGDELRDSLARPLRLATLPNPVLARDPILLSHPRAPGPFRLAAAGRLVPAKGFDILIAACARLAADGIAFQLTIHGEGPLRATLAGAIAAAGLEDRITLAGYARNLPARLVEVDLFVLSSRREGFGNVIVEAMAAGIPVLATRCGGAEGLIADGVHGFLVPPEDPAALATAIAALAADPARRAAVRAAAAASLAPYGIAPSTRRLETLLTALAATRSTAS